MKKGLPIKDRFEFYFSKGPNCWVWVGGKTNKGYGIFHVGPIKEMAHRISYTLYKAPIPNGFCVCHKCDNPSCVNPDHLFLGTNQDNKDDSARKGRTNKKLTREQVSEIKDLIKNSKLKWIEIANRFNISTTTISNISLRYIYKEVI